MTPPSVIIDATPRYYYSGAAAAVPMATGTAVAGALVDPGLAAADAASIAAPGEEETGDVGGLGVFLILAMLLAMFSAASGGRSTSSGSIDDIDIYWNDDD